MYTDRPISLQSSKFLSRLFMDQMFHILKYNDSENKCTNWRLSQYIKEKRTCEFYEKFMNWIRK